MTEKRKENRGGVRMGAGRKPIFEISDTERREIIKTVKKELATNKTSIGQELSRIICGHSVREKLAAISLYTKNVLTQTSEKDVNVNQVQKPQIFIPEEYPDSDEAPCFKH